MRHNACVFEELRTRSGMYLQDSRYATVFAFVQGYDTAHDGGTLLGFREWLVLELGVGRNLSWPALVLQAAFPDSPFPEEEPLKSPESNQLAVETFFRLFRKFSDVRDGVNGVLDIFVSFSQMSSGIR